MLLLTLSSYISSSKLESFMDSVWLWSSLVCFAEHIVRTLEYEVHRVWIFGAAEESQL